MTGVVAMYLRISLDDNNRDESNSIANQRSLLCAYVGANPELAGREVLEFVDDGWSGTNFERPRVRELLEMARHGDIGCIVVKDSSRWGRNYIEVNEYIEQIFPFLGIRFISVNDYYDSNDYRGATAPIDMAFRSLVHDIYSKDLSVKVRQSYEAKAKRGEYVCGHPPFGYLRSTTKKNRLVIDEGAAAIVRRIFGMACAGMSGVKIAAALNEAGVDTATAWRKRNGRSTLGRPLDENGRSYWSSTQVISIVRDERYTGTLLCFMYQRDKVGSRRQIKKPQSEWMRVPGALPAIITKEQFDDANARVKKNKKSGARSPSANRSPLTGKIVCGHCGLAMRWAANLRPYHYCAGPKVKRGKGCYEGKVDYSILRDTVLAAVKLEAQKAFDASTKRVQSVAQGVPQGSPDKTDAAADRTRLTKQLVLLERRADTLYEDYVCGRLDRDGYLAAKADCKAKVSDIEIRINALSVAADKASAQPMPDCFVDEPLLRRVLDAVDLTEEVLALVDCVVVYDPGRIEIRLAFGETNAMEGLGYGT